MHNTLKTAAIVLALTAPASPAEELAPDALVKTISTDVLAAIRQDKDIQAGNPKRIASLVAAMALLHFDLAVATLIERAEEQRGAGLARARLAVLPGLPERRHLSAPQE